jgi:subtilase family serine protease
MAIVDKDNWIAESDETNNERTVTVVTAAPDLIIEAIIWSPETPSESDYVTFTVTITNQGSGRADHSYVAYYIDDDFLASASVNATDPGATVNMTFTWIAQAGTHAVRAVADYNDKLAESDETNNEMVVAFSPLAPDLVIESIVWSPEGPSIGDEVAFTVTVKNQGSGGAVPSRVHFYVGGSFIGYQDVPEMDAGATATTTFTWTAQAGLHAIRALVDPDDEVTESDETNNGKTIIFPIPDLVIEAITGSPSDPVIGDEVTFTVTISNRGTGKASSSQVACYIDDAFLASASVGELEPGATANMTFTWVAQAGSHTARAVVDSGDMVAESDETNNEKAASLTTIAPDLIIEAIIWLPESPSESDNVTFTVTIKNQGNGEAGSPHVAYYIDDAYLTSTSVNEVAANATANMTFIWTAQAGAHIIKAVADDVDRITESDENNNERIVALSVSPPPAPAPEATSTPGPRPREVPAQKAIPTPSPGRRVWLELLIVLVGILLLATFVITLLKSRQQ